MKPLVSVITPLFNSERYISETIESVLSQTYDNWEMLIVDNCSTDNSRNIVKEHIKRDERIKLIELAFNSGGPARPRNIGLQNARGAYIAFLDADDIWHRAKLEKQVDFFIQNKDFYLLYSPIYIMKDGAVIKKMKPARGKMKSGYIFEALFLSDNFIACSTVMVRNEKELGIYFDEDRRLIAVEDFDLWLRIARDKKIGFIYEPLLTYRVHDGNASRGNVSRILRHWALMKKWRGQVSRGIITKKYIIFFVYAFLTTVKSNIMKIVQHSGLDNKKGQGLT